MEKKVEFKVGYETLLGSLFVPSGKGPFPGVLFFHGRGSDRIRYVPMAKKLSEHGIMGLAFDFRGCGESDGEFKNQSHKMGVEDAVAGLEFLLSQNEYLIHQMKAMNIFLQTIHTFSLVP